MERVGKPYTDVVQLIQDVLHGQVMEEDNRYMKHDTRHISECFMWLEIIKSRHHWELCVFFFRIDDNTSNSPTSELNNLFNQVTVQMTNNSANKNSTQKSDAFERESGKRKTDNESDDLSK